MPCDESPVYVGSSEAVNSPIITAGSRRSGGNKIAISSSSSNSSSSSGSGRSRSSHDISKLGGVGSARNHYGTVAMAPRPLHSATTLSSSRSSSSSSSSSGSSTVSSSFDRQPRNESANSSSSLILILERAGPATVSDDSARSVCKSTTRTQQDEEKSHERGSTIVDDKTAISCFTDRVASSLENLAKKKSARCRRRRSATSPRKTDLRRSIDREADENREIDESRSARQIDDITVEISRSARQIDDRSVETSRSVRQIDDRSVEISRSVRQIDDRSVETSRSTRQIDDRTVEKSRSARQIDDRSVEKSRSARQIDDRSVEKSRSARQIDDLSVEKSRSARQIDDRSVEKSRSLRHIDDLTVERSRSARQIDDGFVATSTLTKNRDASVLSVLTNSSRSAGRVRLQSSSSRADLASDEWNSTAAPEVNLTPCATAALKSQKSTISVASIRVTNAVSATETRSNNEHPAALGGTASLASVRLDNDAPAINVRCNTASASAPTLLAEHRRRDNNDNNRKHDRVQFLPRASASSHSTSLHSTVPLDVSSVSRDNRKLDGNGTTTTCRSANCAVGPSSSLVSCTILADGDKSSIHKKDEGPEVLARIDSSSSLKSSSLTTGRMRIDRQRASLHASLGQLPISSCTPSTLGGDGTSLENLDTEATSTGLESITADPISVPINLCSSSSNGDPTTGPVTRESLERAVRSNAVSSTISSTSSRTPAIAIVSSTGNPTGVSGAFRNSLVASGCVNNKTNSNNNGRCNHSSGTCTGNCTVATTNSHTSSTLPRTPSLVAGVASTSTWANNSGEQETDYVVDPVQGNAYHKGQFLGKGGFARVYLMTDVANGNQYACKIIPKNRMQKIHIQKIAREIMIHKELNHVNVVQMHHYFEDNINVYMLLEPCPRKSLMHVLKYRGKVTEPEARYYMKQMVTGVAYIHSQKVVHRDLKPGNMFLSDGMIVKIGDFGLATRPDGQRRRVTICGTPNYIAPEVLYKQAYSYEADVWALGCILYALLAGQPPFDTATLKETYARICNNRYKKLDDSLVSRSGQDLIRWLLQPIPELRPSLERVKEHAYLTMEYVPTKLAHTCCYRMPTAHSIGPEQSQLATPQQLGLSCTSIISRGLVENIDRSKRDIAAGAIIQKNINHMTGVAVSQLQLEALKNSKKKPKVGNWLFRKLPKLPRFRQRLSRLLCPEQKKPDSTMMHRALEACLAEIRCTRALENPMLVDRIAPLFVTKWIDYSNKYGLGFQLSDRSVGVLFNDSTKMSYTRDRRRVEYATTDDDVTRYRRELDVPSCMEEKLELLRHFTHYMDNFLTNGGEVREQRSTKLTRTNSASVPRMRRWLRTDKAIVMELTVPLLQVNFFVDHSKIVVSEGTRGRGYLVTYIDASRQASSYWLNDLRDIGCTAELYERLHYVCKVIAELENEAIFDPPAVTLQQHRKTFKT